MASRKCSKKSTKLTVQVKNEETPELELSFSDKIRTGYYETQLNFPLRHNYVILEEVETKQTIKGFDEKKFKSDRKAYDEDETRLYEEFKRDALKECGILGHPKADRCFSLAWTHGHDHGYQAVFNYLDEFSHLLKD